MSTQNNSNGKGTLTILSVILLIILLIVSAVSTVAINNLNNDITKSTTAFNTAINNMPIQMSAQINTPINQLTQHVNNQFTNLTTLIQGENAKIDATNVSVASLKASLDTTNKTIADLKAQEVAYQTANQATINNLQTTINNLNAKLQQRPYYPYYPNYPNPNYPYYQSNYLSATVQSSSNVLSLSTSIRDDVLRYTTIFTLKGYVTILVSNPYNYDISNNMVVIDFQLSGNPTVGSSNVQLTGTNSSWTSTIINSNQLRFQTSDFGISLNAGQSLTLPLTLTITQQQPSAIAVCPWVQSYSFVTTVATN
jgi:hypothetical protein